MLTHMVRVNSVLRPEESALTLPITAPLYSSEQGEAGWGPTATPVRRQAQA